MRMITKVLLAAGLALLPVVAASADATVDVDAYIRRDGYGRMAVSPDGRYLAAMVDLEDRGGIVILRREGMARVAGATGGAGTVVDDFQWVKDDRLVLSTAEKIDRREQPVHTGALFSLGVDGRVRTLVGPQSDAGLVDRMALDSRTWEAAQLVDPLPGNPREVLISVWDLSPDPKTRIERIDVVTGRRTPVASAPVRRATFTTDPAGRVRFADGRLDDNAARLYYRPTDDAAWALVNDQSVSGHEEHPLGFAADGVTAYLRVAQPQGPDAVVAWNTTTNERHEVQRDAIVDPAAPVFATDGRVLLGMRYLGDTPRTRLFDPSTPSARMHAALAKAFPDKVVDVTSYTRDGRLALVEVGDARTPGDTYLFDTTTMTADGLFASRQWFDPAVLPAARPVAIAARDGLVLHGTLTPPRGANGDGPWPTVVMPHGGPFDVFDAPEFDDDTHLLAEAGYAVLRVNFRGSGNYGAAFRSAGAREWGGRMQDDLTDATRWAVAQKLADPARICIYGASYGGYAALMGVAREPGLYRCAVGYVGVYDLRDVVHDASRRAQAWETWSTDWIGEGAMLAERSPVTLAARIDAPVLLVAGGADTRAPIGQSRAMERALRAAGKPVETYYVDTEGHGFYSDAHRREFYVRLLDFLSRALGGATAMPAK